MSGRYRAAKVKADGHTFDSKMEYARYQGLSILERVGEIRKLEIHPTYPIHINGTEVCKVELDFRYERPDGSLVIEDVKGHDNALSRLKRKLVEAEYAITVKIVKERPKRRLSIPRETSENTHVRA